MSEPMKIIGVHEGYKLGSKFDDLQAANDHQAWLNKQPNSLLKGDPEQIFPLSHRFVGGE